MNKRIVAVTGASGNIGKVLVEKLLESNYVARILLRDSSVNYWKNTKNIEVVRGDINDKKVLEKLFKDCWGIIHLAVEMDSGLEWEVFKKVNVDSVAQILELAPTRSRIVMASSVVVYADTGTTFRGENWRLRGGQIVDKYIKSKVLALKLVRESKRKVISVMPSTVIDKNIFGREKFVMSNKIMAWVWNNIGGGIPGGLMAAVGSSDRMMNLVEVHDVSKGIILALEKGRNGEEYILSGTNITAGNYLRLMAKKHDKGYLRIRIPTILLRFFGMGPLVNMGYSYEKAKTELGYEPTWTLL